MERLLRACVNSWNGLGFALRSEAAFRQELVGTRFVPLVTFAIGAQLGRFFWSSSRFSLNVLNHRLFLRGGGTS